MVFKSALVTPVRARLAVEKLVVVALVPVALVKVKVVRVDEAPDTRPLEKTRVVVVAFSPVPSLVQGKANEPELRSVAQSQSLVPVFFKISPLAQVRPSGRISPSKRKLPKVVKLPDEVAFWETTFWRVVEASTRS